MDDPYRGTPQGSCPRCLAPLFGDVDRLECPRGCGDLLTRHLLDRHLTNAELDACEPDVGSLIGRPFPPATCPTCSRTMMVRIKHRVVFDYCPEDGIWLDQGELPRFEAAFDLWRKIDGD